ncbi:hypothetical protein Hanom_Chr08g00757821 [Helianthus anomalus]
MSFSSLRFGHFCDFRPKVCFSSKKFEILPFSSLMAKFRGTKVAINCKSQG